MSHLSPLLRAAIRLSQIPPLSSGPRPLVSTVPPTTTVTNTNTDNSTTTTNPTPQTLRSETLRTIEQTTDSFRRLTTTIENAYNNLASVRNSLRRTMDEHSNLPSSLPNGDRQFPLLPPLTAPNSNANSRERPGFLNSAFNSNMAPSHSAIILADGTEVISPVTSTAASVNGRDNLGGSSNPGGYNAANGSALLATYIAQQGSASRDVTQAPRTSPDTTTSQSQRRGTSNLASNPESHTRTRPLFSDPPNYDQYISRYTSDYNTRIASPPNETGGDPRLRFSSYSSLGIAPLTRPRFVNPEDRTRPIRSASDALQSFTAFLEEFRSTMNRVDEEIENETRNLRQRNEAMEGGLPARAPTTNARSPSPTEEFLFGRRELDPYSDDPSTTLGRRVQARAAASARTHNVDPMIERASDFADRVGSHLDRLARHRDELLEASNGLRRGPASRPIPLPRLSDYYDPTTRPRPTTAQTQAATGPITSPTRARRRRMQEENRAPRLRTSHIDRTGRLSYNPTLPEDHPLAYIHQTPSVPIPGLTSHDFDRADPVTGRRRRYTVISPVRDGADDVHTITMSDSSSDEEPDPALAFAYGLPSGARQTSPRRMRARRRQRTLSQGASRPLLERNRERGNRRSISRDRMPARMPSFSSTSSDEDDVLGRTGAASRPIGIERKSNSQWHHG